MSEVFRKTLSITIFGRGCSNAIELWVLFDYLLPVKSCCVTPKALDSSLGYPIYSNFAA